MKAGLIILDVFALAWLAAAFGALGLPPWTLVLPVVLSAAIAWLSLRQLRDTGPPPPEVARSIARTVGLWSAVEAILIALAVFVLVRLGRFELIAPTVAIIVGLHFVPLARALRVPLYTWTAAGLVVVGAGALLLPFRPTLGSTGIGVALVLYATSFGLGRSPPASRASPHP